MDCRGMLIILNGPTTGSNTTRINANGVTMWLMAGRSLLKGINNNVFQPQAATIACILHSLYPNKPIPASNLCVDRALQCGQMCRDPFRIYRFRRADSLWQQLRPSDQKKSLSSTTCIPDSLAMSRNASMQAFLTAVSLSMGS
jgi:hypothetical protein